MRLRVRTPDGELTFASRLELSKAYSQGLVDANDEIQEEGSTRWRKAGDFPELRAWRNQKKPMLSPRVMSTTLTVGLSVAALYFLFREDWTLRAIGLALSFSVAYLLMGTLRRSLMSRPR